MSDYWNVGKKGSGSYQYKSPPYNRTEAYRRKQQKRVTKRRYGPELNGPIGNRLNRDR